MANSSSNWQQFRQANKFELASCYASEPCQQPQELNRKRCEVLQATGGIADVTVKLAIKNSTLAPILHPQLVQTCIISLDTELLANVLADVQ
jgi:hypothetical protein